MKIPEKGLPILAKTARGYYFNRDKAENNLDMAKEQMEMGPGFIYRNAKLTRKYNPNSCWGYNESKTEEGQGQLATLFMGDDGLSICNFIEFQTFRKDYMYKLQIHYAMHFIQNNYDVGYDENDEVQWFDFYHIWKFISIHLKDDENDILFIETFEPYFEKCLDAIQKKQRFVHEENEKIDFFEHLKKNLLTQLFRPKIRAMKEVPFVEVKDSWIDEIYGPILKFWTNDFYHALMKGIFEGTNLLQNVSERSTKQENQTLTELKNALEQTEGSSQIRSSLSQPLRF